MYKAIREISNRYGASHADEGLTKEHNVWGDLRYYAPGGKFGDEQLWRGIKAGLGPIVPLIISSERCKTI